MEAYREAFEETQGWSVDDASSLYMIDRWGGGYFGVDRDGNLTVAPLQENGIAIPIIAALREAQVLGLAAPILVRFRDLLRHRVLALNIACRRCVADYYYR